MTQFVRQKNTALAFGVNDLANQLDKVLNDYRIV
tara:strand:+ start:1488 stop:1589 length:102 start_codon:yes stop_codon:yes gene_type:complete